MLRIFVDTRIAIADIYFDFAVLGPDAGTPGGEVAGMPLNDLVMAWNLPFASDDPSKKGCPPLDP